MSGCLFGAGIKPEVGGVSLTAVRASSNSISGSSPGGWPHHVLPASQVAPESCIRGELPLSFSAVVIGWLTILGVLLIYDEIVCTRSCSDASVVVDMGVKL